MSCQKCYVFVFWDSRAHNGVVIDTFSVIDVKRLYTPNFNPHGVLSIGKHGMLQSLVTMG
jgi:hypothetical protein